MTRRAFIWCGQVRGDGRENDFPVCVQDVELACRAARRLGVPPTELWAFVSRHHDLLPQGFPPAQHRDATVAELRQVAAAIARVSSPDDALLFVGANHGDRDLGLIVSTPPPDPLRDELPEAPEPLTPEALASCLDSIAGQQILLIGACYGGVFCRIAQEQRRAVLTACDDTEVWSERRSDAWCSAFLAPIFEWWTGEMMGGAPPVERLPLDDAFERVRKGFRQTTSQGVAIVPRRAGTARWP